MMGILISSTLQEIYERGGGLTSNATGGALSIGGDQVITIGGSTTTTFSSNGSSYNLNAGTIALTTTAQTIIEAINEVDAASGGGGGTTALQASYDAQAGVQVTGGDNLDFAISGAVMNLEAEDGVTVKATGATGDLTLGGRATTITLNQTSETGLVGYPDANSTRTIDSIVGALNNAGHIVGFKEGVDLTTATGGSPVTMFTVPTGKKLLVTTAYALIKTVTGYSGNPAVSFSFSGGGDAINSETLIAVSTVDDLWTFLTTGNRHAGTAAETLRYEVDTASSSTTLTADLVVCGILVDA
jgi:hypothetical protein